MSVSYWLIEGISIDTEKLFPHIDKKKFVQTLHELLPDDADVLAIMEENSYQQVQIDDFFDGNPYESLADLLTHCEDTSCTTYASDGDGGEYFFYPPRMPWRQAANEPDSMEEVHRRLIQAVHRLTSLTSEEIEELIDDDLYVVGIG